MVTNIKFLNFLNKKKNLYLTLLIFFNFFNIKTIFAADIKITNLKSECSTTTEPCSSFTSAAANNICLEEAYSGSTCNGKKISFDTTSVTDGDEKKIKCATACYQLKNLYTPDLVVDVSSNISSNSFTRSICNALRVVTGSAGKTFAAFAIIAVGIGFFSGKVSWGLMIGVAAGIAAMFGAPSIVAAISGTNTKMDCGIN